MKIRMVDDLGNTLAEIESCVKTRDGKTRDHGVVVGLGVGQVTACDTVNSRRVELAAKLDRLPTSEEIVADLATDTKRFQIIES